MRPQQLKDANALMERRAAITKELGIWEKTLTEKKRLGYIDYCDCSNPEFLKTNVADDIFIGFRQASIDNLKVQLAEIDKAFTSL